jgi:ankyrin repeat protein
LQGFLSHAAVIPTEAVVRLLLESKADVEAKEANGRTPLYLAEGNKAIVRLIESVQEL